MDLGNIELQKKRRNEKNWLVMRKAGTKERGRHTDRQTDRNDSCRS